MVDTVITDKVSELSRVRYQDQQFEFGRTAIFDLAFTRKSKTDFSPYSSYPPFSDSGSFQSRKYFTRPDYTVQNTTNGGMQIRGLEPRVR